ncbi:MAG: nicotinamide riboside transporter PnuC [Woeseiaceae bacterium]|nr:nicotinamide riboside transporter PnuC [Woeseiaceae bacterium]
METVAVITAVLYLLLAIRQNIWCWLFGGISTAILTYLSLNAQLYMQSALNAVYFGLSIYGWFSWRGGADEGPLEVTRWPLKTHALAVPLVLVFAAVNGYALGTFTDAEFAYVDAAIAWAAIWTTFLAARKVLESWWYWLVIDIASAYIFWAQELPLIALLYVFYIAMIPFGLLNWTRSWKEARA